MPIGLRGLKIDGRFQIGKSSVNAARSHQIESAVSTASCISTTRDAKVAEKFATSGNMEDGWVYVIEESRLDQFKVSKFECQDPEFSHEQEVILMTENGNALPPEAIVNKYEVLARIH